MPDTKTYLKQWVTTQVLGGFTEEKDLRAEIEERVNDEMDDAREDMKSAPAVIKQLRQYAKELFAKRKTQEKKWKRPTMNDRIDAAFAELNGAGIIAMQNAGYTMSMGWEDCNEEAAQLGEIDERPRGATFYHGQDLERGVEDGGLMLVYGAYEDDDDKHDASSIAIAREVIETLERYGVKTKWNGKVETRVEIRPFKWQKRQFTKAPKVTPKPAPKRATAFEKALRDFIEDLDVINEKNAGLTDTEVREVLAGTVIARLVDKKKARVPKSFMMMTGGKMSASWDARVKKSVERFIAAAEKCDEWKRATSAPKRRALIARDDVQSRAGNAYWLYLGVWE